MIYVACSQIQMETISTEIKTADFEQVHTDAECMS